METKKCSSCKLEKNLDEFSSNKNEKSGKSCYCKICFKNKYYNERPITEELRKQKKESMKKARILNPLKYRAIDWNKQGINITPEKFLEIFDKQDGKCAICKTPQEELKRPLGVDHDHKTGKVRGLLCRSCNLGLGNFKDDFTNLTNAIEYLKI